MSRVFGMNFPWMISCSSPRVLLGDKIILTLEFLKFCGKNPNWKRINMEAIIILWFGRNWWTLG